MRCNLRFCHECWGEHIYIYIYIYPCLYSCSRVIIAYAQEILITLVVELVKACTFIKILDVHLGPGVRENDQPLPGK